MFISGSLGILGVSLGLAASVAAVDSNCTRDSLTDIVTQILDSMVAHDPTSLPLAKVYRATENSHPAALKMMTSWRTITEAGTPSLLALDTTKCSAYFALDISEGNSATESVLRGRVQTADSRITELELFINRDRGDHGFSFNATELAANYGVLMSPPANRTKPSRATLEALSEALFANSSEYKVAIGENCQFTEIGWRVVDTGAYGNGSSDPLGCIWPDEHPVDTNARVGLVIDEELGFVVTSGMVQGKIYPYNGNVSAFIPNDLPAPQKAQEAWMAEVEAEGVLSILYPFGGTGDTLEVLQYYNEKLQAMQINVYLSGPNMTSAWL